MLVPNTIVPVPLFFNGKLFELLIFDRLLTTEELANMSHTLAATHKIDLQAK